MWVKVDTYVVWPNLLVDLSTVVVALLTSACYGIGHTGRVPGSDASHLPQSLVSFPGELLCVPAACHTYQPKEQKIRIYRLVIYSTSQQSAACFPTFEAMTPGDTNDIDHLILVEDSRDGYSLLQTLFCPVHLVTDVTPI